MTDRKPDIKVDVPGLVHMLYNQLTILSVVIILAILGYTVYITYLDAYYQPEPDQPIAAAAPAVPVSGIVNGVDTETGLIAKGNWEIVRANCTSCHSAKLITQNRQDREGWKGLIVWMQETQGLWDLGDNETLVLDYLATHYAPEDKGRRAPLKDVEWYVLDLTAAL